ncbi:MAG: stalk domain-containing protein [Clostridia bacterium]|nr:stalk domain-containing protein [Clostridia bacterium]
MKKPQIVLTAALVTALLTPQAALAASDTDTIFIPGIPISEENTTDTTDTTDTTKTTNTTVEEKPETTNTDTLNNDNTLYNGRDYVILTPNSKTANFNGTATESPAPYIKNGTSMLPLRFICQDILKANVNWNNTAKTVQVDKNALSVKIDLKKGTVISDGKTYPMTVKPELKNNTTYIPLRLLAELFNCQVNFDSATKKITVILPVAVPQIPPVAYVQFNAITAGQALDYMDTSYDPSGLNIIKREWQVINNGVTTSGNNIAALTKKLNQGTYTIRYRVQNSQKLWSDWQETSLIILKNEAPVITTFNINTTKPQIGQDVDFSYTTQNESWESITAVSWSFSWEEDGTTITKNYKPRAFFKPGENTVTLKVQDAFGNWSEPASLEVNISSKITATEAEYRFTNLLKGDLYLNMAKVNFNLLDTANMINFAIEPVTQLFSDNPEKVYRYGVLYKDTAQGNIRLHYYHENIMTEPMKIYTLVHNTSDVPVTITIGKVASAGPTRVSLQLGTKLGENYFNASPSGKTITLAPDGKYLLNPGIRAMKTNEVEAALIDVYASSPVTFVTVAMSDAMNYKDYTYLYQLEREISHTRGTFLNGNMNMTFELNSNKAEKIILGRADAHENYSGIGIDATTGNEAKNLGNYGVLHTITITAETRTGILVNPRGSIFQGVLCWNGEIRPISAMGYMRNNREAAAIGIIEAGETVTITYMTPDGSDSPMLLVAIPTDLWNEY